MIASVSERSKVTEKGRALDTGALIEAISKQDNPMNRRPLVPELRSGDVVAMMSNGASAVL